MTNLQAPFFLTQALLPLLKASNKAQVLFTSAECGRQSTAFFGKFK